MAPVEPLDDGRAAPARHVPLDQTTLPRHVAPDLPTAPHLVVSVGREAAKTARSLLRAGDRHRAIGPDRAEDGPTGRGGAGCGVPGGAGPCRDAGTSPTRTPTDVATIISRELTGLTTGWRVLAVGPERDVLAVRAAALAAGALDVEITLVATDVRSDVLGDDDRESARVRLVFCGACHRRFDARAAVRDHLACPGCGAVLTVAAHHSRRHGAFLGVPAGRRV